MKCWLLRKLFFHCIISALVKSRVCSLYTPTNMRKRRRAELIPGPAGGDPMTRRFCSAAAPPVTKHSCSREPGRFLSGAAESEPWPLGRTGALNVLQTQQNPAEPEPGDVLGGGGLAETFLSLWALSAHKSQRCFVHLFIYLSFIVKGWQEMRESDRTQVLGREPRRLWGGFINGGGELQPEISPTSEI